MSVDPARHRLAVSCLTTICVLLLVACRKPVEDEVETETVVSVKTSPAIRGNVRGLVHATGVVTPAPGAELVVVAPEAARIAEIPRAAGDRVRKGDLLVRFEIPTAAADVERQQAELARAEATVETAKAAQVRARELFDRGVAARREVEDAARTLADAEAAARQAQASLKAARTTAGRSVVRASFDGIIAKRLHNPGDLVEPAAGDAVLQVIDPHRLELVAAVPLNDAARVAVGASAHLTAAPIGVGEVRLKVVSRAAAIAEGTATVPIRLAFAGPIDIPAGAPLQVDIDAEEHRDVVVVPVAAVVREGEETAVFVATGTKAERRTVRLGLADATLAEVIQGVKAGDLVIVDGQAGLPDGATIAVRSDDGPTRKPAPPDKDDRP